MAKQILANEALPIPARNFIADQVNGLPAEFNGAAVDAHGQFVASAVHIHISVTPKKLAL